MKKAVILFLLVLFKTAFTQNLDLLGHLPVHPGNFVTDVWGYVDTVTQKEYAIVGAFGAIEIIDVTDPYNPQQVAALNSVPGFDMKVWRNYLYLVTGGPGVDQGIILDITVPENPVSAGTFNSAHNIFISEDGYLFAEYPGLIIYNLNPDPLNPVLVWSSGTADGHDATVIGDRVFDFHGWSGTNIYQYTTGSSFTMNLLGSIITPEITYHHSGWPDEDGRYLFICDEGAVHPKADITVWDISDLSDPVKVGEYADPAATVHNLYVVGNYAYTSYYTAGLRIFDVSNPANMKVAAEYDTYPGTGEGFRGAFGVYVFSPNGNIFVSDSTGLYIFRFDSLATIINENDIQSAGFELYQNYPNPFNPITKISFVIGYSSLVTLRVYDVLGNEITTLLNEEKPAGTYEITFNAGELSSGIYYYRLSAGSFPQEASLGQAREFLQTKKMVLVR
jgi:choice-of-anchor B domain-containing protein